MLPCQGVAFLVITMVLLENTFQGFANHLKVYLKTTPPSCHPIAIFLAHSAIRRIQFCHSHSIILHTQRVELLYNIIIIVHTIKILHTTNMK